MLGKHHLLSFVVGLFWGAFQESNATSSLGINLKVDVNGKTVVDKSIPNGKLCYTRHFLFHMIKINTYFHKSYKVTHVRIFFRSFHFQSTI